MLPLKNKSLYAVIFSLIFIFVLPIILYNGFYVDDNVRIITGKPDWNWVGRTFADWLMKTLSLNTEVIDDFSPIPLVMAIALFSLTLYQVISKNVENISIMKVLPFIFLIVNPFFMQNLTYKFDSLPMTIALSCAVFAYFYENASKVKKYLVMTGLLVVALELYQPCANVFIMLGAANLIGDFKANKEEKWKSLLLVFLTYAFASLLYMLLEKVINPDAVLSRGHIVPLSEFYPTILANIKAFFKIVFFITGHIGLTLFVLPIIGYWLYTVNNVFKHKASILDKLAVIMSPFILFFCIWGPLLVIKELISLPRELPTVGVILFLDVMILIRLGLYLKSKVLLGVPVVLYISCVLLCGLFINIIKIQDSFNEMVYNSIYLNITNNPKLYNVKEIKINGNVPVSRVFESKVKANPYFYSLTMATPEWITRTILIRKGLNQVKLSFEGKDKTLLKTIIKEGIKPEVNNQFYMIYKYNNITTVWFK